MPTIHTLARDNVVHRVSVDLRRLEYEDRFIYLSDSAREWIDGTLPNLASFYADADMQPLEQVIFRFHQFITGKPLNHYSKLHIMRPVENGLWELKTTDVRMMGWFPERDHYVIARVDTMERCKVSGLYNGYQGETIAFRTALGLADPGFVAGDIDDVISNAG